MMFVENWKSRDFLVVRIDGTDGRQMGGEDQVHLHIMISRKYIYLNF